MHLDDEYLFRFAGTLRLFGETTAQSIYQSHICVIGLGGVGSWATEFLARTGIHRLTLVDDDEICLSNSNRQIQALTSTVGQFKTSSLLSRIRDIHPFGEYRALNMQFSEETAPEIFRTKYDYVVDATDRLKHKLFLLHYCRSHGIPVVTTGGAGGRRNPWDIRIADLNLTHGDRLLFRVRKRLKERYAFPNAPKSEFNIPCVYSAEAPFYPAGNGCVSQEPQFRPKIPMDCSAGIGSAGFVTATFGIMAAAHVVQKLSERAETRVLEQ